MCNEMEVEKTDGRSQGISQGGAFVSATTDATAVVRFGIGGLLRFLSHAETLRLFERACARARVHPQTRSFYTAMVGLSTNWRSVKMAAGSRPPGSTRMRDCGVWLTTIRARPGSACRDTVNG